MFTFSYALIIFFFFLKWLGLLIAVWFMHYIFIRYANYTQLMDFPSDRSSHCTPTLRGGGIVFTTVFLFFIAKWKMQEIIPPFIGWVLLSGGVVIALVGFLDDLFSLAIRWRLMVQILTSIAAIIYLSHFFYAIPGLGLWNIGISIFGVLGLSWFINLYNFMDGIDGLAGSEAIFFCIGTLILLFLKGYIHYYNILLLLMLCVLGFLYWNWAPARLFMGDVGSSFLGYTIGILSIFFAAMAHITIWAWFILLSVFILDATWTLIYRFCKGERWYQAHCQHAFQILTRYFGSHYKVTLFINVINYVWLLPFSILATYWPQWAIGFTFIALIPIFIGILYIKSIKMPQRNYV